jgi:hypothetical protein
VSKIIRADNSRLGGTASCSSMAATAYVCGYQGRGEPAPRKAGKDTHVSLAEFFKTRGDVEVAMKVFEAEYRAFAEQNVPPGDRLSWENLEIIMREYYDQHPIERFPFDPIEGSEEQAISAMLTDNVEAWGILDLRSREKTTGARYVVDHKTTGRITSWWTKQFRLGSQLSQYIWLDAQESGEIVTGAFINAIEFGKLPSGTAKCYKHKVPKNECMRYHAKWELLITSRSSAAIQSWLNDARALARKFELIGKACTSIEMIQYMPQEGRFNGSCTFCQFRDFCDAGRKPELVEAMLVYAPWEPWN